jgi:hypothetical protein
MWHRGYAGRALRVCCGILVAAAATGFAQTRPARAASESLPGVRLAASTAGMSPRPSVRGIASRAGIVAWQPERATNADHVAAGSSDWTIEPTANLSVANGAILAGSCSASAACVAVGYYTNMSGNQVSLVETWDGASWKLGTAANPAGFVESVLGGVSCSAADSCIAVGTYVNASGKQLPLVEDWNGTTWSVQKAPKPQGSMGGYLSGVSCLGATRCMAVGTNLGATGIETLAETWNGKAWQIQTTPNPSGSPFSSLSSVSCASATACVAVGSSEYGTLAEAWNGASWKIRLTPNPADSSLAGVSCPAADSCIAVGSYFNSLGTELSLAEAWNGTTWEIQSTPTPKGSGSNLLASVSCSATDACTAVGSSAEGALAETWNGSTWKIQVSANPNGNTTSLLSGVSCSAAQACAAVGSDLDSYGIPVTLAESSHGNSWTIEATPNHKGLLSTALAAVSCSTADACVAVGYTSSGTLAESWNGSSWSIQPTPNHPESAQAVLAGVSCVAADMCTAVGSYLDSSGQASLAETWNGTSWTIEATPSPAGSVGSAMTAVSCVAADACTAVGTSFGSTTQTSLAEAWNGTSWTIEATPSPAGSSEGILAAVSCAAADTCEAVGNDTDADGTQVTLAEGWDGTTWKVQPTPNPGGAIATILLGVSCSAANACNATGGHLNSEQSSRSLDEIWDGTAWNIESMPNPTNSVYTLPFGVSCTAADACTAVGFYQDSLGTQATLADTWDGTSWTVQTTPNPSGAVASNLSGVSCTAATVCTAVGASFTATGFGSTLGEAES